jgi:GTPase SAR1 family protein
MVHAPIYGQVVAGPPGAGKTTYCTGMQEYLRLLGRDAWVINLDPANEIPPKRTATPANDNTETDDNKNALPYETLLDVCDQVVNLSSVMKQLGLGPNGGLVYCMEYLEAHADEIVEMIRERVHDKSYLLFDLPGQVELYTHGTAVPRLLHKLCKVLDLRLVAIQLIDAHYCTEAANFLSAALLGTLTILRLELPTVSVLSKIDLLTNYGPLPMSLDFFVDCFDLTRLLPFLGGSSNLDEQSGSDDYIDYADDPEYQEARQRKLRSPFFRKHEKMHQVLAEVVEDFGLLSFLPLDISNAESVGRVLARIDKCNGYVFTSEKNATQDIFQCAVQSDSNYETIADIQERLTAARDYKEENERSII